MNKFLHFFFLLLLGLSVVSFPSTANALVQGQIFSYNNGIRFERLMVENGLPNATVLSAMQDQDGFMWFATADGLARYDGLEFTIFRHSHDTNSLSNNNTFCLAQSADGLIWIGTDPGGLNVYDPQTGQFHVYLHNPDDPESLVNDSIWSVMVARDGRIWIGTREGLSVLDRQTGKFKNYQVDPENPRALAGTVVYRIYQDKGGTIWVGTRNGLQRYVPATDDFDTFKNNPDDPQSISSNNVWSMLEDSQGNFWVGTRGGGLNLMDRQRGTFKAYRFTPDDPYSLSDNRVWFVFEDSHGNLWVTTENGGLNLFDRQSGEFMHFHYNPSDPLSLSNDDLFWMTEDRSGALWITSRYGGVNRLAPMAQRFGLYSSIPGDPQSLSASSVYSILAERDGTLWVGTFGGGLNRIDRAAGQVTVYRNDPLDPESLSNDKIYYIYRDEKGVLWLATAGGGLNRMDPQTGKFTAYRHSTEAPHSISSNFLTVIDKASAGRLWVGTLGFGLDLFNPATGETEKHYAHDPQNPNSLSEDTIYDLAVEKSGRVWIATARGGLDLFDPRTETFLHHLHNPNTPNSILSDTVHAIYLDETSGMLWAATSSGLSGLELASGNWRNYTSRDGLPTDTLVGVLPGKNNDLWLSSGKGISHFQIESETFTNYDARDGLQGDQFQIAAAYLGPDGELFFGGSAGLTYFRPDQITINSYRPVTVFTDFQLFNQSVQAGSDILPRPINKTTKITLAYNQSVFTLKFAALSYQISSKNTFQYKMEGFDKNWSPPSTVNQATYTNLAPGHYAFLVRAANHDGVWNEEPARLEIEILPPWWGTWWFRLGALLTIIAAILGGVQWRINSIRAVNRELEKRVDERTRELQEAQQQLQIANVELQTQLAEITLLEQKVREQAVRDALTGLYNRHYLSDMLTGELMRASRGNYHVAFLLIDLDRFKEINDTFGHMAGDFVLQNIANVISAHTRRSDIACRYGGEEFLLVVPEINPDDALKRAEQLRSDIQSLSIEFDGQRIPITASIGVALYPLHGENSDAVLSAVDEALYKAKERGRNQVIFCTKR